MIDARGTVGILFTHKLAAVTASKLSQDEGTRCGNSPAWQAVET